MKMANGRLGGFARVFMRPGTAFLSVGIYCTALGLRSTGGADLQCLVIRTAAGGLAVRRAEVALARASAVGKGLRQKAGACGGGVCLVFLIG